MLQNTTIALSHYAILTAMLAPAFFLTATAALLASANTRLARVVDRLRSLIVAWELDAPDRAQRDEQILRHRQRAHLVLRACRLLGLRRQYAGPPPKVTPSRCSPVEDAGQTDLPRTPTLPKTLTPEDAAFLRRVMPQLLRVRAARTPPTAAPSITASVGAGRRASRARTVSM